MWLPPQLFIKCLDISSEVGLPWAPLHTLDCTLLSSDCISKENVLHKTIDYISLTVCNAYAVKKKHVYDCFSLHKSIRICDYVL